MDGGMSCQSLLGQRGEVEALGRRTRGERVPLL
jgi:hypothetical protein